MVCILQLGKIYSTIYQEMNPIYSADDNRATSSIFTSVRFTDIIYLYSQRG